MDPQAIAELHKIIDNVCDELQAVRVFLKKTLAAHATAVAQQAKATPAAPTEVVTATPIESKEENKGEK